jgi:hypothetical protein
MPGSKNKPTLLIEIREAPCPIFSAWRIVVHDPRFRTREGLGVGSTLGEVRRHYTLQVVQGEGAFAAVVPSANLAFMLDAVDKPRDASTVNSVLVTMSPQEVQKRRCPELGFR